MFRGGHLSAFFLGGLQVSSKGDLANWIIPGKALRGMGAMDSVGSGGLIVVCMTHLTDKGEPKILERCTFPLTGAGIVNLLITDYVEIYFFLVRKGNFFLSLGSVFIPKPTNDSERSRVGPYFGGSYE